MAGSSVCRHGSSIWASFGAEDLHRASRLVGMDIPKRGVDHVDHYLDDFKMLGPAHSAVGNVGKPCMGVRKGGSMGSNDSPSPKRGHLHHWNFFFKSRSTLSTLSTIALIRSTGNDGKM